MHNPEDIQPTRLHLSGVETPIFTQITAQTERGMTVEQALPFLKLQTSVWGDAQRPSRIESVRLVVTDGMPRLLLDLAYDDQDEVAARASVEQGVQRSAHAGVVRPRSTPPPLRTRMDETLPFEQPSFQLRQAGREPTQTFVVEAAARALSPEVKDLALSSMERELLQPKDWVFHVRRAWLRSKPHLARVADASWQLTKELARRAGPVLARAGVTAASYGRRAWQRVVARRSYSGLPKASASPTLPSQS